MTLPASLRLFRLPRAGIQGLRLRRTVPLLPPAGGPTSGRVPAGGPALTAAAPLSLLVIGESTAAGCGVDNHEAGVTGTLAQLLAAQRDVAVDWQALGRFGATARQVRKRLVPAAPPYVDLAVLLTGVNDVLALRRRASWARDLGALIKVMTERCEHLVVAGLPPMRSFPALLPPLRDVLAERAERLDRVTRDLCEARGAIYVDVAHLTPSADFFAIDGFHPGPRGYRQWAELIADRLGGLDTLSMGDHAGGSHAASPTTTIRRRRRGWTARCLRR